MFHLEQSITAWRKQMLAAGIKSAPTLSELEAHLRDEIRLQMQSGADEPAAFAAALAQIGPPAPLHAEFKKIGTGDWNRSLAWTAWTLFVVSFILPAYDGGAGWRCAGLSAVTWSEMQQANWFDIHLALLTLANLLMLATPFLFPKCSLSVRAFQWLRGSLWAAVALVWSYVIILFVCGGRNDLQTGCYVWMASFLVLALSTVNFRSRNTPALVLN